MAIHKFTEITYWPTLGSNGYGGYTFGAPTLIEGRWEERTEKFMNDDGEEIVSNSIAYIFTDVEVGDFVAEGNFVTELDPTDVAEAFIVKQFQSMTDLRAMEVIRKVML